jgi:hypothetical protein
LFMVIDEYDRGMSESLNGEFELLNLEWPIEFFFLKVYMDGILEMESELPFWDPLDSSIEGFEDFFLWILSS